MAPRPDITRFLVPPLRDKGKRCSILLV